MIVIRPGAVLVLLTWWLGTAPAWAQSGGVREQTNGYRVTLNPSHRLEGDLSWFSELTLIANPDEEYETYMLGLPGLNYKVSSWLRVLGAFYTLYTDNHDARDKLELRPSLAAKLFVPNGWQWSIFNYSRVELREIKESGTGTWTDSVRLRSRQGAAFPLSRAHPWGDGTFYGLADAELFFTVDTDGIDPLRLRGGLGYVLNDRVRLEFIYQAEYTRPERSSPLDGARGDPEALEGSLEFTDVVYRVNIKLSLHRGLLRELIDADHAD